MVGSETAAYLGMQCKSKVAIVEMRDAIAMDMEAGIRDDLKDCLRRCYVEELKDICETVVVGDAVKARQAIQASSEGFKAGLNA